MQETTNTMPVDWDPDMSITGLLRQKWEANPAKVQWERKASLGTRWVPVTIGQFVDEVRQAAKGLMASGVQRGDRVGIMAHTSYEWTLLDFASWWCGAIPVPVYETSSADQGVDDAELERRSLATRGDDVATIIYTSGTTGRPKGVVLWHRNFVFITHSGRLGFADVVNKPNSRTLMFLPLAHVFARFIEV